MQLLATGNINKNDPNDARSVAIAALRSADVREARILRAWAAGTDAEPNWLAGALDPQIGLALSAIHRDPGHEWTVEELARACNLSRSAFAAQFALSCLALGAVVG